MLTSTIIRQSLVRQSERFAMYDLHSSYFCNLNKRTFFNDMSMKDWIIILRDGNNIICGFSTIEIIHTKINNKQQIFLFSGDTIVNKKCWNTTSLAGSFGHIILRLNKRFNNIPLYWFLISKGYRTYRYLPIFFKHFYPAYNANTPLEYDSLLKYICGKKFRKNFDPSCGIIKFAGSKDYLIPEMNKIPTSRKKNPHVSFFLEKNPGFIRGDELACIASISLENLNRTGLRVIENTEVIWNE